MGKTTVTDFTIRHYQRGEEQKMADLVNACRTCEWEVVVTAEMIEEEWNDERLDLERDTWVAVNEAGDYIAAAEVWFSESEERAEISIRHLGFTLHPDYRESHNTMLEHLFDQAMAHAMNRPFRFPGKPGYLRAWASARDEWKQQWILAHDFEHVHSGFTMLREELATLPPVPALPDIHIEGWSPERDEDLWLALNEAFSTDEMFVPLVWNEWIDLYHGPDMDPSLWRIAVETSTGQIVGLAIAEIDHETNAASGRQDGWVTDIAVLERYRGRGIGRATLLAAMHALRGVGMTGVKIGVDTTDTQNATRLYESLGFRIMEGSFTYRKLIHA